MGRSAGSMSAGPGAGPSAASVASPAGTAASGASAAKPPATAASAGSALVPSTQLPAQGEDDPGFGPLIAKLPVELDVGVPIRDFRVRHLLALEPGAVIESKWNHGNDLPLAAGDVKLAWTEFEVIETRLAVRVTRLA